LLLYVVYMCQKSLNFTYAFKRYQQKCKWLHFSWATLYIRLPLSVRVSGCHGLSRIRIVFLSCSVKCDSQYNSTLNPYEWGLRHRHRLKSRRCRSTLKNVIYWSRQVCFTYTFIRGSLKAWSPVAAGRGAREGGRPGWHFAGATFEGRKCGILAFALQCVSVSLYLFLIYSVLWGSMGGAGWRGGIADLCPGGKNLGAATDDHFDQSLSAVCIFVACTASPGFWSRGRDHGYAKKILVSQVMHSQWPVRWPRS